MSTTSEYLYDETNIVNSDIKGIKLSEEFINEFNVTDLDWKLLESSLHMNSNICLLYTSPSPRDRTRSRMPSSA